MLSVSVRQFRVVCVLALTTFLLSLLPALDLLSFSKGVTTLRMYRYYGALAPAWVIWDYAVVICALNAVGLIGMLNFWRLSRWCLVAAIPIALVVRPFLGLAIYSPYETFFASLFGSSALWLITVSFWTPIAERFAGEGGSGLVP